MKMDFRYVLHFIITTRQDKTRVRNPELDDSNVIIHLLLVARKIL